MTTANKNDVLIGVVGPCSAGKSTLIAELKKCGLRAKHIAQEHSYVKDMWRKFTNPDLLIFLHVSYPVAQERRKQSWTPDEYETQIHRLRHAAEHAHFHLDTDQKSPAEIVEIVLTFLKENGVF